MKEVEEIIKRIEKIESEIKKIKEDLEELEGWVIDIDDKVTELAAEVYG